MFFASKLIGALKKDHDVLRECCAILKNEDSEDSELKDAFGNLGPELQAHSESEEQVVYQHMLTHPQLKTMALEGMEEHRTAEQLLTELQSELGDFGDKWRAKARILSEVIEHHINEEESQVFPSLKKHLSSELDETLLQKYELANAESRIAIEPKPRTGPHFDMNRRY